MHKRVVFYLTLISIVTTSAAFGGFTRINAPNPDDPMDVHIYQLDNGLTIYLTENHGEPRFYTEVAVRAGSKHDPAEATGLAHYLEHKLFKGTKSIATLDYEKEKKHLDHITTLYQNLFALRPAIDLYNDYFSGGFASIVYQELRETRALAYSTYAEYLQGKRINDPNVLWADIGCQADKTPEAVAALVNPIDKKNDFQFSTPYSHS